LDVDNIPMVKKDSYLLVNHVLSWKRGERDRQTDRQTDREKLCQVVRKRWLHRNDVFVD